MRAQNKTTQGPPTSITCYTREIPDPFSGSFQPMRKLAIFHGIPSGRGKGQAGEGWARSATGAGQSLTDTPAKAASGHPGCGPARPGRAVRAARGRPLTAVPLLLPAAHSELCVPRRPPASPGSSASCSPGGLCLLQPLSPGELPRSGSASCSPSASRSCPARALPPAAPQPPPRATPSPPSHP